MNKSEIENFLHSKWNEVRNVGGALGDLFTRAAIELEKEFDKLKPVIVADVTAIAAKTVAEVAAGQSVTAIGTDVSGQLTDDAAKVVQTVEYDLGNVVKG